MLKATDLFDLSQTAHRELFSEVVYGWEALPMLDDYVAYALEHDGTQRLGVIQPGAVVGDQVTIGEGTVVEAGAVILGPAIIGKNCVIRSAAYLRENVIIGDDCLVGHGSEVKNSLLFSDVEVPHLNYIGDSILGARAHFGAGVVTSNTKNLAGTIRVVTLEETFETGLQKFGALVGDDCEVGVHAVLSPGTILGRRSVVYPLALVRGVLPPDTILKVRQQHEVVARRAD